MKNNAAKFAHEFGRMCKSHDGCVTATVQCPLHGIWGEDIECIEAFEKYPEKIVEVVENWSKANPIKPPKTILSEFMAKFPDTPLGIDQVPQFCVKVLGYDGMSQDICKANKGHCATCWRTPLERKSSASNVDYDPDGAYFDHAPQKPHKGIEFEDFIEALAGNIGSKPIRIIPL